MLPRQAPSLLRRSLGLLERPFSVICPDSSNQCLAEIALGNHWLDFARSEFTQKKKLENPVGLNGGALEWKQAEGLAATGEPGAIVAIVYDM